MTATTKEQRAGIAALIANQPHNALIETRRFDLADLLSDSERLAAIEAVTGEEVRELVESVRALSHSANIEDEVFGEPGEIRQVMRTAATSLLSLSAKVAEQAEEIERLKAEREQILLTVFGGEDAPGYAASLGLDDVKRTMEWWHGVLRDQNRLFDVVERLHTPRPADEYHEDMGDVLWHHIPICEPPYVGSQLDEDWDARAGWYTHFTPLPDCNEINDNATIRAQMEG